VDETLASYAQISAPTLCVVAQDDSLSQWWKERYRLDEFFERYAHVPQVQHAQMHDCGHMLHHDQPQALALLLRDFLASD
jgi:pimeloyl-ACP methyl ester carboxylesterase